MTHTTTLFHTGLRRQPFPIHGTFPDIGIDGEIPYLERREILEKMAALRRRNTKIAEPSFHDHARAGDFIPFDGNAQPRFIRAPAANTNQEVGRFSLASFALKYATWRATSWLCARSNRCESTTTTSQRFPTRPLPSTLVLCAISRWDRHCPCATVPFPAQAPADESAESRTPTLHPVAAQDAPQIRSRPAGRTSLPLV